MSHPSSPSSPTPTTSSSKTVLRPQPGPQEEFMRLPPEVQIAIYGGAAGGGKTWGLLMEPIYHIKSVPGFGCVIFRRTFPEITNEGGLWDSSYELYPQLGGKPNLTELSWEFPPYGNMVRFAHMQHEHDRFKWHGSQIPLIAFDELTTFEQKQFFYMLSRNRSTCGVRPYIRGTTNPDADSWVAQLIAYWIDASGLAIPERSGEVHWFVMVEDTLVWDYQVGGEAALRAKYPPPDYEPMSFTFVPAQLSDNVILTTKDPTYRSKLLNMSLVERERLLGGNWKIRPAAGKVFNRAWFTLVDQLPDLPLARVRYWDKAGTEYNAPNEKASWTVGVKMCVTASGRFVVEHVERGQWTPADRNKIIRDTAALDGLHTFVIVEQEPGSGGKESALITAMELAQLGVQCEVDKVTGDKASRAEPFSWHAEAGHVYVIADTWTDKYLAELHNFPASGKSNDQVDASSGAFNRLKQAYDAWSLGQQLDVDDDGTIPADEIGERFL